MSQQIWQEFLTPRDREVAAGSGYGGTVGFGERPAVLVIDVTTNFCGEKPEPILESIKKWRNSCGEEAWRGISVISQILPIARAHGVPVIYSGGTPSPKNAIYSGRWANKNTRRGEDSEERKAQGYEIAKPITPEPTDIVIRKTKPSVFFGTPLLSYLVDLGVDSLICCGTTTSGCVRATVIDAFSYNFKVAVVDDATFDRTQASHAMNLFDMAQKYADVIPSSAALKFLSERPLTESAR
jgi:maleamate amidohydrolase